MEIFRRLVRAVCRPAGLLRFRLKPGLAEYCVNARRSTLDTQCMSCALVEPSFPAILANRFGRIDKRLVCTYPFPFPYSSRVSGFMQGRLIWRNSPSSIDVSMHTSQSYRLQ